MQADFQPATWKACWEDVVEGRPAAAVAAELGLTGGASRRPLPRPGPPAPGTGRPARLTGMSRPRFPVRFGVAGSYCLVGGLDGAATDRCPPTLQECPMPEVSACPDVSRYARMASGQASPEEKEALARHLEGCDASPARPVLAGTGPLRRVAPPGPRARRTPRTASCTNSWPRRRRADEMGRLGTYRVLKVLGAGGMGVVFQAEDPQLQAPWPSRRCCRPWRPAPAAEQRFLREAQAAAAIEHDHIVTIYQVGEDRGVPFLAMEFLEGRAARRPAATRGRAAAGGGAAHRPGNGRGPGGAPTSAA